MTPPAEASGAPSTAAMSSELMHGMLGGGGGGGEPDFREPVY